ncbi:NAD(P)-binding protein [Rhizoclosmatium globosum]|uniref:NAD(P)-binding protein n=1 Tax=Rhizoclosmatium globosum TaxID=329046 RepID=A0A1Y2CFL5_9FUNG|nr:NAD(P)-binding protein [Rhizoclosmatium globosum]|eukprot:ORY45858.1 NAD(P)-binding protein [Rhizoclosmatium globosum]
MAALLGHVGVAICGLVRLVFFDNSKDAKTDLLALPELLLAANPPPKPHQRFKVLARHLRNSDTLHQALLRAQRSLVRDFASPFAQTQDVMPGFSVFDLESGLAKTSDSSFGAVTDVAVGECSVVHTLDMFKRGFHVFTMGLLDRVPLASDKAVVAGGAVAACLHPWPRPLRELYDREVLYRRVLDSILNRLPPEIVDLIEFYAGFVRRVSDALDRALFTHLCGSNSPYAGSDVDVFFVCAKGDTTVDKALDHLPKVYYGVLENRTKANVAKYIDKRKYKRHWIFTEPDESDPDYDWFIEVKAEIEARKAEEAGVIGYKSFLDKFRESEPKQGYPTRLPTDERGWTFVLEEAVKARLQLLWTVRTTNSITITGVHPVRHTQLMLPVVRAPEQVVYPFDLDCVTVYYDGTTVYATPRSLRAFNTRTNFVDTKSLQDRARCIRMLKYSTRGFNTLAFEICRHFPRCDVDASRVVREVIERGFPAQVEVKKVENPNNDDDDFEDDEWIPLRFDPDLGNPDLEPAVNLMGMDYTPAPLLYGSESSPSDLIGQIQTFEKPSNWAKMRDRAPLVNRLLHSTTSNLSRFRKEIMTKKGNFVPMQFKFLKDGVIGRRVQFATGFHLCYMCKKDVGDGVNDEEHLKLKVDVKKSNKQQDEDVDDVDNDKMDVDVDDEDEEDEENVGKEDDVGGTNNHDEDEDDKDDEYKNDDGSNEDDDTDNDDDDDDNDEGGDDVNQGENRSEDESKPRRIAICSDCQSFNLKKREEVVDLTGKHALVTGGRIKIGQAAALRLLRNGATVHITTRFPLLLLHAFKSQPDAEVWWSRLNVYGLDLRDLGSVLTFCNHLVQKLEHLDILIQNAAQTIRRPAAYYAPMVKAESDLRETLPGHILTNWVRFDSVGMIEAARRDIPAVLDEAQQTLMKLDTTISSDLSSSVLRSLIVPGDVSNKSAVDPNWNLQVAQQSIDPLDMRPSTTWNQSLPDVALSEVAEVLVVNSLAPTLLMQRLQPLLSRPRDYPAFVVNVSSREGSFSATQKQGDAGSGFDDTTGLHPHTNMAKAALNRLTQTIADDWAKDGIYVTAVDPGWVSLMGPVVMEDGKGVGGKKGVIPPLSVDDGAARVLAPVFDGYSNGVLMSGVLLRNFQASSW